MFTYPVLNLIAFWQELKLGYTHFETDNTIAEVSVSASGKYQFN